MQKYLIRRLLLVIPTLWLVISLLFLGVNLLPGDYVTIKLSNLEASGATTQPADIIGDIEIERTLHRVVAGDSVDSLALFYGVAPEEIVDLNPRIDRDSELIPGSSIIIIDGQLLSVIARQERLGASGGRRPGGRATDGTQSGCRVCDVRWSAVCPGRIHAEAA